MDARSLSQQHARTVPFWGAVQQNIEASQTLTRLCIFDQRLDPRSWKKLATALADSHSIVSLQVSCCNLSSGNCARMFCRGLRQNDYLKYLDLSCNELKDEHGIEIMDSVKILAQRRDHLQWMEGLRCEHEANAHLHDHHETDDQNTAGGKKQEVINIEIQNTLLSQTNQRSATKRQTSAGRKK